MKRLIKDTAPSLTLTQLAKMVRNAFESRIMKRRQLKERAGASHKSAENLSRSREEGSVFELWCTNVFAIIHHYQNSR